MADFGPPRPEEEGGGGFRFESESKEALILVARILYQKGNLDFFPVHHSHPIFDEGDFWEITGYYSPGPSRHPFPVPDSSSSLPESERVKIRILFPSVESALRIEEILGKVLPERGFRAFSTNGMWINNVTSYRVILTLENG